MSGRIDPQQAATGAYPDRLQKTCIDRAANSLLGAVIEFSNALYCQENAGRYGLPWNIMLGNRQHPCAGIPMPSHGPFGAQAKRSAARSPHQPAPAERERNEKDREPVSCHDHDRFAVSRLSATIFAIIQITDGSIFADSLL